MHYGVFCLWPIVVSFVVCGNKYVVEIFDWYCFNVQTVLVIFCQANSKVICAHLHFSLIIEMSNTVHYSKKE